MPNAPLAKFPQKLIRRNKEWIFLKSSANDDHRVSPHDIDNDGSAKLGEVVRSYNRVLISGQNVVEAGFVLDKIIYPGPIF